MLAALKSERVVDMSDMEMQLEAAPQENREGRPYLGSVAFYKHVILFFVFLLFVLLTGTVIFFSAHYVSLKKDYAAVCEEYRTVRFLFMRIRRTGDIFSSMRPIR